MRAPSLHDCRLQNVSPLQLKAEAVRREKRKQEKVWLQFKLVL